MNLNPLFTTARVLRASQQITMTLVFFYFLHQKLRNGERPTRRYKPYRRYNNDADRY
jgi:hypothetical protein